MFMGAFVHPHDDGGDESIKGKLDQGLLCILFKYAISSVMR
jgi:hypothetical protein